MAQLNNKPGFDSVKAKTELDVQNDLFIAALSRLDSISLGSLYTMDAQILNGGKPLIGRAEIIKFYGDMVRAGVTKFGFTTTGLNGSDNNMIVEDGNLYFALTNGTVVTKGRYVLVWKREDGKMKMFRDLYFPDKNKN